MDIYKKSLKGNIYLKIGGIVLIGLLLLIPTVMVENIINERQATQESAISEVSAKWGKEQTILGPFISIPYHSTTSKIDYIHILPTQLNVSGNINPEERKRGIYEVVVYNSKLEISGSFNGINLASLNIPVENIMFDKAEFVIGIDDLRGIQKQIDLNWNNEKVAFNPGITSNDIANNGINAKLQIANNDSAQNFSLTLDLNGSQRVYFVPVGKVTDINISSKWSNPSFNGAFLPDSSNISEKGFAANWNVLHLNRNYPQQWTGEMKIDKSAFGVDLIIPADNYQKSYRAIHYAILFISLTFLTFFFIEVLNKVFIHPIQYILVGIALVVFFTLLVSISEHLNFNSAFIIAAIATLLLIAGYVKAILKSNKLTFFISGILLLLYTFIFVIIQLQDYALLIGSIGIFIILAVVMYFSRKIDWYNLNLGEKSE